MYGVMAGQKDSSGRGRQLRAPTNDDKPTRKHLGFKDKILDYLKNRLNPPADEECDEISSISNARHRPEGLQALVSNTRFSEREIKLIYRGFKQDCPSGVVDEEAFKNIFSQFFPLGDASQYAHFVFNTMKHKQTGKVNFEEFIEILSRISRGSIQDKISWVFTLYDIDGDGRISRAEMLTVVQAIYELLGRATLPPVGSQAANEHVDNIFELMGVGRDGCVSREVLSRWCRQPSRLAALHALDTTL